MLKKILIGVGILAVLGVAFFALAGYYTINETIKEKEPEFRKYMNMTVEEQNAYVENNLNFLISAVIKDAKTADEKEIFEKIKADPVARQAGIELGRAIMAKLILASDAIVSDLKEDAKSKLSAESDKISERFDTYSKILEKYDVKKNE